MKKSRFVKLNASVDTLAKLICMQTAQFSAYSGNIELISLNNLSNLLNASSNLGKAFRNSAVFSVKNTAGV